MKSRDLKKVILCGISAGLVAGQLPLHAGESIGVNLDYVVSRSKCKAAGGCGGDIIAERDRGNIAQGEGNGGGNVDSAPFSDGGDDQQDPATAPFNDDGKGGEDFDAAPFSDGGNGGGNFDTAPFGD